MPFRAEDGIDRQRDQHEEQALRDRDLQRVAVEDLQPVQKQDKQVDEPRDKHGAGHGLVSLLLVAI